jgi:hypothetical protein
MEYVKFRGLNGWAGGRPISPAANLRYREQVQALGARVRALVILARERFDRQHPVGAAENGRMPVMELVSLRL